VQEHLTVLPLKPRMQEMRGVKEVEEIKGVEEAKE
jgi:hypothetical protein